MERVAADVCKAEVQLVQISKIEVGWRRRKKLGPVAALSKSIEARGLINPIVLNTEHQLICGERRLEACKKLGWSKVPARLVPVEEGERLREMELEENTQRHDLDEYEASRERLKEWEAEAEAMAEQFRADSARKGGRPIETKSVRAMSMATGVPPKTVHDEQRYQGAGREYPVLKQPGWKKYQALEAKELLDKIDPKARDAVVDLMRDEVLGTDSKNTKDALDLLRNVAEKPKEKQRKIAELATSSDPDERSLALTAATARPPMPDVRVQFINDALGWLDKTVGVKVDRLTPQLKAAAKQARELYAPLLADLREIHDGRRAAV